MDVKAETRTYTATEPIQKSNGSTRSKLQEGRACQAHKNRQHVTSECLNNCCFLPISEILCLTKAASLQKRLDVRKKKTKQKTIDKLQNIKYVGQIIDINSVLYKMFTE